MMVPGTAQEVRPKSVIRVVDVKSADVRQLGDMLSIPGAPTVRWNEHFRTITLSGPEQDVTEAEGLIKRFDIPRPAPRPAPRNIEVVVYLVNAAAKGGGGEALPADLEPVARQLRQSFGPGEFRLIESTVLRLREGDRGDSSGTAAFGPGGQPPTGRYGLQIGKAGLTMLDKTTVVRLDQFRFNVQAPQQVASGGFQHGDVSFTTNLDVREGQRVVVGKANYDGAGNALVLVVAAKPVD
jgi:hypothetical protein